MKLIAINIGAWCLIIAVVVYAIIGSGSVEDTRTEYIHVTASGNTTTTFHESGSDTTGGDTVSQPTNTADQFVTEMDDGSQRSLSADPRAIKLNDSAVVLLSLNQRKAATDLLKESLLIDSGYARAYYNLGVVYQRLNNLGAAIRAYHHAIELRPHYYKPVYNLGHLYSKINSYDDALVWFKRATEIKRSSESAPAHYNLALIQKRLGQLKEAEDSYLEALRLRPGYVEARFNLALLRIDGQEYESAANDLKKVEALGFRPAKLYRNLGLCYSKLSLPQKAVIAYEMRAELDSNNAHAWYNVAVLHSKLDQPDRAISAYQKAIAIDSNYYSALFNIGSLFSNADEIDSALVYYRRSTQANKNYSKAFYNLALLYSRQKMYDSAALNYQKVIELDPENNKALFNLGLSYSKANMTMESVEAYRLLIDQNPVHPKGLMNLGAGYFRLKEYDSAYTYFNRVVSLTHSPQAYFNRAKASNSLDDKAGANNDYREAIRLKPDYAKAYHNLAILEEKANRLQEAIGLLTKAVQIDGGSWKTHWKMGQIYMEMKQHTKAMEEYTLAAIAKPDSKKFTEEYNALFETK